MNISNVQYVRSVSGSSSKDSFFCLVPTELGVDPNYYSSAMETLYAKANLQKDQVLANFREDSRITWYFFGCSYSLTISADIIAIEPK